MTTGNSMSITYLIKFHDEKGLQYYVLIVKSVDIFGLKRCLIHDYCSQQHYM